MRLGGLRADDAGMTRRASSLLALVGLAAAGFAVVASAPPAAAAACSFQQLTDTTGDQDNGDAQVNGDGGLVSFRSRGEFGDLGDNGDGNAEIWRYQISTGPAEIQQ